MSAVDDDTGNILDGVPLEQLEAYPFPAAVLRTCRRRPGPTPLSPTGELCTADVVWSNAHWDGALPASVSESVDSESLAALAEWALDGEGIFSLSLHGSSTTLQLTRATTPLVTIVTSIVPAPAPPAPPLPDGDDEGRPLPPHPPRNESSTPTPPTPKALPPEPKVPPAQPPLQGKIHASLIAESTSPALSPGSSSGSGSSGTVMTVEALVTPSLVTPPSRQNTLVASDKKQRGISGNDNEPTPASPVFPELSLVSSPANIGHAEPSIADKLVPDTIPRSPTAPTASSPLRNSRQAPTSPPLAPKQVPSPHPKLSAGRDKKRPLRVPRRMTRSSTQTEVPQPRLRDPQEDNFKQHEFEVQMKAAAAEYTYLLETTDWSKSRLGPYESWSPAIKTMCNIVFASGTQDSLFFGDVDDIHIIYNKNYAKLVDHPNSFGKPAADVWASLWPNLEPLARKCYEGDSVYHQNDLLLYHKNERGHFVERYHTWSYVPIRDGGKVVGLYSMSLDTTDKVIAQRRLETTQNLVEELAFARSRTRFFETLTSIFERNPRDIPFAMCYRVDADDKASDHSPIADLTLTLESSIGAPDGHRSVPAHCTVQLPRGRWSVGDGLESEVNPFVEAWSSQPQSPRSPCSSVGTAQLRNYTTCYDCHEWPIARALATRQCIVVDNCSEIIEGFPIRQWDQLPESAVVIPVTTDASSDLPSAVLILGLNIRATFDSTYLDWVQVIRGHLNTVLNSVHAFETDLSQRLQREKLERAKTAWFSGAAHEFRTPLTLVAGPLDDVLHSDLSTKQRRSLTLVQRNVQRLQRLVSSLLDFTRVESGGVTARFVRDNLSEFVSSVASLFRQAIERLQIEFTVDVEPRAEDVCFDPVLLETVISNLLSNALKYTTEGSVTVRLTYDDEYARIAVSDTGMGIPEAELEQVTEMFHRTSAAVNSGATGAGLGLALAKELVTLHGGQLLVESSTGESSGSTMTVVIPLNVEETMTDDLVAVPFGAYGRQAARDIVLEGTAARYGDASYWEGNTPSDATGRGSMSSGSTTSGISQVTTNIEEAFLFDRSDILLVVDDNRELREYIKSFFQPYCKVILASSGAEALEAARKYKPHVILSDLLMPRMTGQDLLIAIRNDPDPELNITPMVLLSAVNDDETRLEALIAGAEDYIVKPFKRNELIARVHLHLQVGKKRAKLERLFEQRKQELVLLYDYCPSGILRTDSAGKVLYTNAAFRDPAGITTADGNDIWGMWCAHCDTATCKRLGPVWHDVLFGDRLATKLEWKWLTGRTMSGVFIRLDKVSPDSGLSGIFACITDITYQEEKLLEAERRRIEAEQSRHQQELLVDFTSHEIRTPVSAILQCSSLVKENLVAFKQGLHVAGRKGFHPTPAFLDELEADIAALESIYQCGLVQERIAADVLSLARIQLDMLSLHDVATNIHTEARKVLSVFSTEAKMHAIDIKLVFGPTLQALNVSVVKTDPVRLGQVITNLISNAIRFTASAKTRNITVSFEVAWTPPGPDTCALPSSTEPPVSPPIPEDTPIYLYVGVRDTGPGMAPHEKDALFQRFHQGNKMIHTQYGGSGLGLFICKKITELLGGRIEVLSEVGVGSEFRFYIQARTASPEAAILSPLESMASSIASLAPASDPSDPSNAGNSNSGMSNRSISTSGSSASPPSSLAFGETLHLLIVEDNIINQTVLKRQMVRHGITCDTADNGQGALDAIFEANATYANDKHSAQTASASGRRPFDAILMDLEMPVMDGLTAVRHIRDAEAAGRLPRQLVIALTGNARQGQIDQAKEAGMDHVVLKPYKLPRLLAKIREAVAKRAGESEASSSDSYGLDPVH